MTLHRYIVLESFECTTAKTDDHLVWNVQSGKTHSTIFTVKFYIHKKRNLHEFKIFGHFTSNY